jgi:type VI secretion system protein ImpJ
MTHPRKPIWTEGLFMTPQHLQQGDLYHESLLRQRMRALLRYDWGLTDVQFDERALTSGQVKLLQCEGVFSDGTPFIIGERGEDQVEGRPIEGHFPAAIDKVDVLLAVPQIREAHANASMDPAKAGPAIRYIVEQTSVPDLNTGRNEQSVPWGRSNMRLLYGTESLEAYQTIRIAQLTRDASGGIVVKPTFIPSLLRIGASKFVTSQLSGILNAMVGRQKALAETRRQRSSSSVDFQSSDVEKFWQLHTLNSFIPRVSHMVDQGDAHPEDLYLLLGGIIGELATFVPGVDPKSIPKFNYIELEDVLVPMFEQAKVLVGHLGADQFIIIPLEKRPDGMYLGRFEDPNMTRDNEFYLECGGSDDATLRERLPKLLKVASWSQVGHILNAAIPGVTCAVEYRPPGAIPVKPGLVYLKVEPGGEYWDDVVRSGTIALYQPIDPQKVNIRLIGVKKGKS